MSSAVVQGASSFIGSNFIKKLLCENVEIFVIARESTNLSQIEDNPKIKIIRYTSSVLEVSEEHFSVKPTAFFQIAWQGVYHVDRDLMKNQEVNVRLTIDSIELCNKLGIKNWVGFGSQAEYGILNQRTSEKTSCNPITEYGITKLKCCNLAKELCESFKIDFKWLRLFTTYGPGDNNDWALYVFIRKLLVGEKLDTTNGEQFYDYLNIDDVVNLLFLLIKTKGIGVTDLGSGTAIRLKDVIENIKLITNSASIINYGALPYRKNQSMFMEANIEKLIDNCSWRPSISLNEGLQRTIDFYR